ncbi:TRAP transporter small permease subunit [Geminicoccaceae bacterium 1502E]|nr:TRAP transporter small permease subunit [Geminicoccaceae bacterium 1502E]
MIEGMLHRLQRGAELIGALLFAAMLAAFLLQIGSRYIFNAPIGWTQEASLLAYLWLVFWSAAFLVRERDHVCFSLLYDALGVGGRRLLALLGTVTTLMVTLIALPATADWVAFMKIDRTWDLRIPFDKVFAVYLLFMLGIAAQAAWRIRSLLRGGWRERV